jgi:hypothetical protein
VDWLKNHAVRHPNKWSFNMEKFICSVCQKEKESEIKEWNYIFHHNSRGVNLKENIIYKCASCGVNICKDCKEKNIKTSNWSGWDKAICPKCNKLFAPPIELELKRNSKISEEDVNNNSITNSQLSDSPQGVDQNIITNAQPNDSLEGVHGWLYFFVFVILYLSPTLSAIRLLSSWIMHESLQEIYVNEIVYLLFNTVGTVMVAAFGIKVGLILKNVKPLAVKEAKGFLVFNLFWALTGSLGEILMTRVEYLVPGSLGRSRALSIIGAILGFIIWYTYFKVSKRVKATYKDIK